VHLCIVVTVIQLSLWVNIGNFDTSFLPQKLMQVTAQEIFTTNVADNKHDTEDASQKHSQPIKSNSFGHMQVSCAREANVQFGVGNFNKSKKPLHKKA